MVNIGEGIHSPQHKRYYAITHAMCAEHDWLTVGTASYKLAFNKISENLQKRSVELRFLDNTSIFFNGRHSGHAVSPRFF